jgi:hypothetical protein
MKKVHGSDLQDLSSEEEKQISDNHDIALKPQDATTEEPGDAMEDDNDGSNFVMSHQLIKNMILALLFDVLIVILIWGAVIEWKHLHLGDLLRFH